MGERARSHSPRPRAPESKRPPATAATSGPSALALFEALPVPAFCCDACGDALRVNPALTELLASPAPMRAESQPMRLQQLLADPDAALAACGRGECSAALLLPDGRHLPVSLRLSRAQDTLIGVVKPKEALPAAAGESLSDQHNGFLNRLPVPFWIKDVDGTYLDCNAAFANMLGLRREEVLGRNAQALVMRNLAAQFTADDKAALATGEMQRVERWMDFRGDGACLMECFRLPLAGPDGKANRVIGTVLYASALPRNGFAAHQLAMRFDILSQTAQFLFYDCDLVTQELLCQGAMSSVLGLDQLEYRCKSSHLIELAHPDDTEGLGQKRQAAQEACGRFEATYRLRHAKGGYVHVSESCVFVPDMSGKARRMLGVIRDVSAQHQAEQAFVATDSKYRAIFDSANDAIFILDGRRCLECNRSAEKLLGRAKSEIVDADPLTFAPERQPEGGPSAAVAYRLYASAERGPESCTHWLMRRPDGSVRSTEINIEPFRTGGASYFVLRLRDMTERRRATELLRLSEEKFSKIFAMSPFSISIMRQEDLAILEINQSAETMTGYSRAELLGHRVPELGLWTDAGYREAIIRQLEQDGTVDNYEFRLRRKDGGERIVLNSSRRLVIAGEPCLLRVTHDITEMKLVQQHMVQTEKMLSLGGLAAGMAHEINNPLGIILQAVFGVLRRTDPALVDNRAAAARHGIDLDALQLYYEERNILKYLDSIQEAGRRAAGTVREMLNFSRGGEVHMAEHDLRDIAQRALALAEKDYDLRKRYDFRRVDVRLLPAAEVPPVCCASLEIEQVLLNLLRNAAQALDAAGTLHPRIVVRTALCGGHALLEVEDNGPGITPECLPRVFEPFFTTKKVGEGTGLGLSVSYFIITTVHKGEMEVSSSPGQGARFTIRLPLRPANACRAN